MDFVINISFYFLSGFIADQQTHVEKLRNSTQGDTSLVGPGMAEPVDRFKLNNLSFAGPIIMGVGGKIRSVIINQGLLAAFICINGKVIWCLDNFPRVCIEKKFKRY